MADSECRACEGTGWLWIWPCTECTKSNGQKEGTKDYERRPEENSGEDQKPAE